MDPSSFQSLFSAEGQSALEAAMALEPKEPDFLRHFAALSRRFPRELARDALEIAVLRGAAAAKFPRFADRLYFTREALEQASSTEVAAYRAKRFAPFELAVDLGCSAGGDTLALCARNRESERLDTIGIDHDPLRLAMASANVRAIGREGSASFVMADLESSLPLSRWDNVALIFDPGRREGERRAKSVRDYHPPLDVIRTWLAGWPNLCVKASPAVRMGEIAAFDAEVEFVSLEGELKEAVLWLGSLRGGRASRRATVLPGEHTLTGEPDFDGGRSASPPRLSQPGAYIYEPDPAVIRAGLVRKLGTELDAPQLDADIAFLTSDRLLETPFARAFETEDWLPFNSKRLRAYLRERNVGRVTVSKRGSPIVVEKFTRGLKLRGDNHRRIVLTQLDGKPIVIICR